MSSLLTILINNYNYGRFLRDAVDSALNQSYSNTEVIVVDDGSTDDSRQIITSYGSRIIPVTKQNGGQASAFNAGFAASHGEWILFLDSDDKLAPQRAEKLVSHARRVPVAGCIAHNLDYCDAENRPIEFADRISYENCELTDQRKNIRKGRPNVWLPATSGLAFRRDVLSKILPMPEDITITADNYIKFAVLSLAPVLLIDERLAVQRLHNSNRYTRLVSSEESILQRYLINAQIMFHLRRNFPMLARLVWKMYGRTLFHLASLSGPRAKEISKQIRSSYSPFEYSPLCCFHVCAAYLMSSLNGWMPVVDNG